MMEQYLYELLDIIQGKGAWAVLGKGITSYVDFDNNNDRIHSACLKLEDIGLIYRRKINDKAFLWMPVDETN
jgi:hypothetical protein